MDDEQTFEQEFGAAIKSALAAAGYDDTMFPTGGNIVAWHKRIDATRYALITAYEGQAFADPADTVWTTGVYSDDGDGDLLAVDVTLADAIAATPK